MTLSKSRSSVVAAAACGVAAALALSGCSAGQISQSASQQPAVNGTLAWVGDPTSGIALRNLHLRAPQTNDYVPPGTNAELLFVAVNESAALPDRLVSITSPVGTVQADRGPSGARWRIPDRRDAGRHAEPAERHRGRRDRSGGRPALPADQQWAELPVHVHLRAFWAKRSVRADLCGRRAPSRGPAGNRQLGRHGRPTGPPGPVLSVLTDTVSRWRKRVRRHDHSTAVRNAITSARSGWAAARTAAVGEPSRRSPSSPPSRGRCGPRRRTQFPCRSHQLDRSGNDQAFPDRRQRARPGGSAVASSPAP